MDSSTHTRYLDYLELRVYFARSGDAPKLDPEQFAELDRELSTLIRKEQAGKTDPEEVRRIVALRRILFRD